MAAKMSTKPQVDRSRRYENGDDFFALDGSVAMRLSRAAAVRVCDEGASRGFVVARIEGGNWEPPYFVSRLDCIWDGVDPPVSPDAADQNNAAAKAFLLEAPAEFDVFIITAPSLLGWKF